MHVKKFSAGLTALVMSAGMAAYLPETSFSGLSADETDYYYHYDMENGVGDFTGRGAASVSSSTDAFKGNGALSVTGREAKWNGAQLALDSATVSAGSEYAIGAAFKGAEDTEFKITLQYDAGGETTYDKVAQSSTAAGNYIMLSNSNYKIPAGAENLVLVFESTDTTCDFTVDEVVIAKAGTAIEGPKGIEPLPVSDVRGDLDGDKRISVQDLLLLKSGVLSGWKTPGAKKNADVDQSRTTDAEDALYVQKYLLGTLDEFPVNTPPGPTISDSDKQKFSSMFSGLNLAKSWKYDGENNPLTTQRFGADPGWLVYNDRLYLYTTNDAFEYLNDGRMRINTYDSGTINCVSTDDMINWTDHGPMPIAARNGRTKNGVASWAFAAWAPDACCKMFNGKPKFYLFFANSGGGIGVVMSDSPTGPWKDPIGGALLSHNTPNCSDVVWMFDPGVYYDEKTDECYLFFGGGRKDGVAADSPGTGRVVKVNLQENKVSLAGNPVKMDIPYLFEDSSVIKVDDTWYYSYCANWNVPGGTKINGASFGSADICYMTSKDPLKWSKSNFTGMVFANTGSQRIDGGGNNHHSIIKFKDKYYVAYHARQQVIRMQKANGYKFYEKDGRANNGEGNYRSTHINEAQFSGGKFTCKGDMKGTSAIGTLNPYETVQAETMQNQAGIQIGGLGDTYITDVNKGDWTKVANVKFDKGASAITAKVRSKSGGVIKVCTKQTGDAVAYIEVPAGSEMQEVEAAVFGELNGTTDLYFIFSADGIEFDSWKIS
ncbi:MAG: family 43 glycosylhydrolase [Oscillospiraceae bacterium]|nr:family 43 glycosylhydrolase [Oscillospiraceae bacterium]